MSIRKVYYNQMDNRWKNHPYPAPGYESATVGSSGCAPTCAAMVVSSARDIVYPDQMANICEDEGFRVSGGTSANLFPYVAKTWELEYARPKSSYETFDYCQKGWFVVILCSSGLWTTGGHYILGVGTRGDQIEIYDPYLYNGKFDRNGRQGKVSVEGNSCFVQIDTFKKYSNAQSFYAFKIPENSISVDIDDYTDMDFYATMNEDLKDLFGNDEAKLREHFNTFGINEPRIASYVFDKNVYLDKYKDIRDNIGGNSEGLYNHFANDGIREGRTGSILYDPYIYWEKHEDLRNAFGDNKCELILHYLNWGIKEKRVASYLFDIDYYMNKYKDLKDAFGTEDGKPYTKHFMTDGLIKEGRVGNKVFDVNYYKSVNKDLQNMDNYQAAIHFISHGVKEGRLASSEFNVQVYKDNNEDLRNTFGNDWERYFRHFITTGQFENRKYN